MITSSLRTKTFAAAKLIGATCFGITGSALADSADTVWLVNGGRIKGTVMVDDNKIVSIRLADGKTREVARAEVMRVAYAAEVVVAAPAPAPAPAAATESTTVPFRTKRRSASTSSASYADEGDDHDRYDDDGQPRRKRPVRGRGLIAAGGVLTAFGWVGVLAGAIAVGAGVGGGNEDTTKIGGITVGVAAPIAITGSVLLGVGVRQRRQSMYGFDSDERSPWDDGFAQRVGFEPAPLTLTFKF